MYFPHSTMAGKHEIDCLFCHTQAEKGPNAGIPTVSLCMKCHLEIQTKDHRGEVKEDARAPGGYELSVESLEVIAEVVSLVTGADQ